MTKKQSAEAEAKTVLSQARIGTSWQLRMAENSLQPFKDFLLLIEHAQRLGDPALTELAAHFFWTCEPQALQVYKNAIAADDEIPF